MYIYLLHLSCLTYKDIRVRVKRSYTSAVMLVIKVRECTVILYWNRRPPLVLNQVKKLYMSCTRKSILCTCKFMYMYMHFVEDAWSNLYICLLVWSGLIVFESSLMRITATIMISSNQHSLHTVNGLK